MLSSRFAVPKANSYLADPSMELSGCSDVLNVVPRGRIPSFEWMTVPPNLPQTPGIDSSSQWTQVALALKIQLRKGNPDGSDELPILCSAITNKLFYKPHRSRGTSGVFPSFQETFENEPEVHGAAVWLDPPDTSL